MIQCISNLLIEFSMAVARRLKRLSIDHKNDVMMTQSVFLFEALRRGLLNASLKQTMLL